MHLKDDTLILISCCVSALGIIGLLLVTHATDTEVDLGGALASEDERLVTIHATITRVSHHESLTFLELADTCTLHAKVFTTIDVKEGERVVATGTISTYKGRRELTIEGLRREGNP